MGQKAPDLNPEEEMAPVSEETATSDMRPEVDEVESTKAADEDDVTTPSDEVESVDEDDVATPSDESGTDAIPSEGEAAPEPVEEATNEVAPKVERGGREDVTH